MQTFDVVIVGAGIAGASLAWRLAGERQVLLLERESQPGYHSSGRSAAMFMASYGPPQVRALTRASLDFYAAPPAGFTDAALLSPRGALYIAAPGQAAALAALRDELLPSCPGLRTLDAAQALALVPCLRAERLLGALHDDEAMDIDVHALHQGFLRGLRQRGGELRCDAALSGARRDGAQWQLQIAGSEPLRCAVLVDAAGAWADEVAALCGAAPIGLQPRRRSAFTFRAPPGVATAGWPVVADVAETFYFKPDAGQLLGSPANADDTVPQDVRPEEIDIATGIDAIEAATTLRVGRPTATWAGLRSFVPDGELVIGFDAACPGFFWLAGQGGYGIQSAAGASALADALLRGVALPQVLIAQGVDAAALSPGRLRRAADRA